MTTKIQECRHSSPIYRICVQQGIYNFNLIFEKGKNIFKIKLELRRCSTFIFVVFQEFIKKKSCFLSESAYSYQRTKLINDNICCIHSTVMYSWKKYCHVYNNDSNRQQYQPIYKHMIHSYFMTSFVGKNSS